MKYDDERVIDPASNCDIVLVDFQKIFTGPLKVAGEGAAIAAAILIVACINFIYVSNLISR